MSKRIEIEQKFYCNNHEDLVNILNDNKFEKCSEELESDEYFTDIDSVYIKNRTCLRIRNVNNEYLELTFKGKSKELTNNYAKIENNINLRLSEYDGVVGLLFSLGYFSYSVVNKKRIVYTRKENELEYNVMIDKIENVGDFVEFELLSSESEEKVEYLQCKLNDFVKKFEKLNFQSADLPYRDFVAHKTYTSILPQKELTAILFDLDGTLINSEQKFFESFKCVIFKKYNYNISYNEYETNELQQNANLINELKNRGIIPASDSQKDIMVEVYKEYETRFTELLNENEVMLNFELLKQIKNKGLRLALVSTSRKKFIDILLSKLQIQSLFEVIISRDDVESLKPSPEAYNKALELLNVSYDSCIAVEDSQRGIESAIKANIKTIQVNDFVRNKISDKEISEKLSRILFAIINFTQNN